MYLKSYNIGLFIIIILAGCTNTVSVKNEKKGNLVAKYQLVVSAEKKILLDYETAPKPPYVRVIKGANGEQILTFVNPHKNAIYFYDYESTAYIGTIEFERQGPDGILRVEGYYIKNMDSIYVYNRPMMELVLTDSSGLVKQRISLRDNRTDQEWGRYYPQYFVNAVNPLIEINGNLIMTGMSPFSISDSLIRKFRFTSCIDLNTGNMKFIHNYPKELYGSDVNWQDPMFMQAYREISPNGEWLYSFPVSHDIYVANKDTEGYKKIYAGSNTAGTIRSLNDGRERTPDEIIYAHILQQDLYTAILHDPYRHCYYRFMLKSIPNATINNQYGEKPIVVIIMDEQFNYMGETHIGNVEAWNWENSFVTSEGLVMEFIDLDVDSEEEYFILKTFSVEKIDK